MAWVSSFLLRMARIWAVQKLACLYLHPCVCVVLQDFPFMSEIVGLIYKGREISNLS